MPVLPALFLLGLLFLCGHVEAQSSTTEMLKQAALQWEGPLTCDTWDCDCTFNRQRGCCCGANDLFQIEEDTFKRIANLWHNISTLNEKVYDLTASVKIAFKATMNPDVAVQLMRNSEPTASVWENNREDGETVPLRLW
ncbi:hypothetical protein INR49_015835 [Caranx melampygus]|nr:hypothetical protein INR49_015835 [Caranx melampygus]